MIQLVLVQRAVMLQGMFNDDAFGKVKKGARISNVARGGVIDDHALARAIDAGQVAQVLISSLELLRPAMWPMLGLNL